MKHIKDIMKFDYFTPLLRRIFDETLNKKEDDNGEEQETNRESSSKSV